MRRIYLIISVIIGLGSVLLNGVMQTPAVQAQADPNAPNAPHTLYLPVIARSVPTPTPTPSSRIKSKNGIHLGNRGSDWRQELFTNISTATVTGTWPAAVVDDYCKAGRNDFKTGHISQYVSADFQTQLRNSLVPTFITEADRKSPCQNGHEGSAEGVLGKFANAEEIRDSLRQFIATEEIADYVIVWLLTNEYASEDTVCQTLLDDGRKRFNPNYEQNWHEAYYEAGAARTWFQLWWPAAE